MTRQAVDTFFFFFLGAGLDQLLGVILLQGLGFVVVLVLYMAVEELQHQQTGFEIISASQGWNGLAIRPLSFCFFFLYDIWTVFAFLPFCEAELHAHSWS